MNSKNSILDSLNEGVITIDKDFTVTYFNRSAEKLTGLQRTEVTGKKCSDVCKSPFYEVECPIAIVLKTGRKIYDFDSVMQSKQHGKIPVRLNAAILFDDLDQPIGGPNYDLNI